MKGKDNTALTHVVTPSMCITVAPIFTTMVDTKLLDEIKEGYKKDKWCIRLRENLKSSQEASKRKGLLCWKSQVIIPQHGLICKSLYPHDTLGHYSTDKSYGTLHELFYWPYMQKDLEVAYIPSCDASQGNKSTTK